MSEIRANTVSDAAGTGPATLTGQSAAKVYYEFSGIAASLRSGSTFNCSSLTDQSTGNFNVNFTSAMSQSYSPVATSTSGSGIANYGDHEGSMPSASYILHRTYVSGSGALTDFIFNSGAAFGELA